MNKETHWFEKGTKFAQKHFSWLIKENKKTMIKINKYFTTDYKDNLNFTGLDVEPYTIFLFAYSLALISFLILLIIDLTILGMYNFYIFNIDFFTLFLMISITTLIPFVLMKLVINYPINYAKYVKIHSLGDIPEILSYLVMYLKLVPNLENSVKFAASESSTSLADDLRKMLWDMEIRIYHGVDEALNNFANFWGRWNDHFKRSLHLIRSSIHESEGAQRIITLNRALDVGLDGTRDLMNQFSSKLHQPAMVIYSIGIMIPLSIIAMLPAAGLIGLKITIFQVFFLYDIILPLIVFLYTHKILLMRPASFNPPNIPNNHPNILNINKRKNLIFSLLIGLCVSIPGFIFLFMYFT